MLSCTGITHFATMHLCSLAMIQCQEMSPLLDAHVLTEQPGEMAMVLHINTCVCPEQAECRYRESNGQDDQAGGGKHQDGYKISQEGCLRAG